MSYMETGESALETALWQIGVELDMPISLRYMTHTEMQRAFNEAWRYMLDVMTERALYGDSTATDRYATSYGLGLQHWRRP